MEQFIQHLLLGLLVGSVYGLIAMGLVAIFRASGVLNFAQGQFLLIGALIIWTFVAQVGLPLWLSLILGLGCAALFGFLVQTLTIRPLIGQPVFSIIGMTLGLAIVLEALGGMIWTNAGRGYPVSYFPTGSFLLGNIYLSQAQVYSLLVVGVIFIGLLFYLRRSRSGLAMQAVADDTQCAQSLGVRAGSILSLTWMLAAALAMLGGYLIGDMSGIQPIDLPYFGFKAIAAMIVGGLESIEGAMVGGLIIGVLEFLVGGYIDPLIGMGMKDIFPYIVLLIILVIRPAGLFGWKRIERI